MLKIWGNFVLQAQCGPIDNETCKQTEQVQAIKTTLHTHAYTNNLHVLRVILRKR